MGGRLPQQPKGQPPLLLLLLLLLLLRGRLAPVLDAAEEEDAPTPRFALCFCSCFSMYSATRASKYRRSSKGCCCSSLRADLGRSFI